MISKTDFVLGHQCSKALWLKIHGNSRGITAHPLSVADQHLVEQGIEVGCLAQKRYPGGIDLIDRVGYDIQLRAKETQRLIGSGAPVMFEPVLIHEDAACAVDILVRDADGWKLEEVKSSTSLKDVHVNDTAFQYHVLTNSGINVKDVSVVHLDSTYARRGTLDLDELFLSESVLDEVLSSQADVESKTAQLQEALASQNVPDVDIGPHCKKPQDCPFRHHCWRHVPERSVLELSRGGEKSWRLYRSGITVLKDIPAAEKLSPSQRIQVEAEKTGEAHIERGKIEDFLLGLAYPIAHIDFETDFSAVPEFDCVAPYQQLPFQWSCHRQETPDDEVTHSEFLADAHGDPREDFIRSLLETVRGVERILVYNRGFEDGRLRELQDHFPNLHDQIQQVRDRIVDLMLPFQRKWYYDRQMHGSYSIKKTLPALVDLSYSDLAIADGGSASAAFVALRRETDARKIAQVRADLLRYCERDTLSMVLLLAKLYEV